MKLFIDIETISQDEMPSLESVKIPGNITKPETIMRYQLDGQKEQWKRQALDSMQGRIVCVGYAVEDKPVETIYDECEQAVMGTLSRTLIKVIDCQYTLVFAGWNILSFDLPWIWRKAIQYNLPTLREITPKNDNKYRTIDLMKVWAADYKDYVSLDKCASFLGIPHEGCNGEEIHDLWQAGNYEGIAAHCKRDVETTREIYKRIYE